MAATFLKAQSYEVGLSLIEDEMIDITTKLTEKAKKSGIDIILPVDVMVADEVSAEAKTEVVPIRKIQKDKRIVDIGPRTIGKFKEELRKCRTIFWNGPVGIFEISQFAKGTRELARLLASLKATTVLGGGSTAEAANEMGLADKMSFVSTGGGASLEFLSGEKLPGVEALLDKKS
jgi:phosphoglycerate kinase